MSALQEDVQEKAKSQTNGKTLAGANPSGQEGPEFKKSTLREWTESFLYTIIMAIFGITFVVRSVNVPTGSMENTIFIGDFLLVNKYVFGTEVGTLTHTDTNPIKLPLNGWTPHRTIKRGDIIVFKFPPKPEDNYVKRVIGLPGETIEIRGQRIFINNQELPENRVIAEEDGLDKGKLQKISSQTAPGAFYTVFYRPHTDLDLSFAEGGQNYGVGKPFRIPEGCYFAMGDNRDNSFDSRFWGPVPRENIIGKPLFVYASVDAENPMKPNLNDFLTRGRWGRVGTVIK
ncbi:MAG: signal peptidase I [Blastocatellia bacterium]|nr:signal peptidase I [Blastocatellia bacterium]